MSNPVSESHDAIPTSGAKPTLTDFLLARIAEDEARVRVEGIHPGGPPGLGSVLIDWEERRWLAECKAKRRIVERCGWVEDHPEWANDMEIAEHWESCSAMLDDLALPYADHRDYRQEWKP